MYYVNVCESRLIAVNSSSSSSSVVYTYTFYILGDTLYTYTCFKIVFDFAAAAAAVIAALFCAISIDANVSHRHRCCHSIVICILTFSLLKRSSKRRHNQMSTLFNIYLKHTHSRLWTFQFEIKISDGFRCCCFYLLVTIYWSHAYFNPHVNM